MELTYNQIERIKSCYDNEVCIIYSSKKRVHKEYGVLKSIGYSSLSLKHDGLYKDEIEFKNSDSEKILHIYNHKFYDVFNGHYAEPLSLKMRKGNMLRGIITNIRKNFKKEIFIVQKPKDRFSIIHGIPVDMGISKLKLNLMPPSYDQIELSYNTIFHIYNEICIDLLNPEVL